MTNEALRQLIEALLRGKTSLDIAGQVEIARKLLRANQRIQAARLAGFVEDSNRVPSTNVVALRLQQVRRTLRNDDPDKVRKERRSKRG